MKKNIIKTLKEPIKRYLLKIFFKEFIKRYSLKDIH